MNFKRNLFSIIALIGTLVLVSSCVDKRAFKEYSPLEWNIDAHEEEIFFNGAIKKPGNYLDSYATTTSIENKVNIGSFYDVMTKRTKLTSRVQNGIADKTNELGVKRLLPYGN